MKKSVNFNGMKKWRGANANDLLATFRFLGMSDDEIKAKLLEMKAAQQKMHPTLLESPQEYEVWLRSEFARMGFELNPQSG